MSWQIFGTHEEDGLVCVISLVHGFCLWQFFSPLFGFFWLVPGFVEVD